jgi:hypothetical protein
MPVKKYRSIEEMNREQEWLPTGDAGILQRIRYLWRLSGVLLKPVGTCIPKGVRKYHSIEDANVDRDRWEEDRIERLRTERKHSAT